MILKHTHTQLITRSQTHIGKPFTHLHALFRGCFIIISDSTLFEFNWFYPYQAYPQVYSVKGILKGKGSIRDKKNSAQIAL